MAKLFLISLDLLVALPILGVASLLLFSSIYSSQTYALGIARGQYSQLGAFEVSQEAAPALDSNATNYTSAESITYGIESRTGFTLELLRPKVNLCSGIWQACRIVTVSGVPYLLVVSNEGSVQP